MPNYGVILPTLNGLTGGNLPHAISSILNQSITPSGFAIVDGGSTDGSQQFLQDLQERLGNQVIVHFNNLPDKKAITIVHHYNRALELLEQTGTVYDWYLFHADDCLYPADYVERLLREMYRRNLHIASGDWGVPSALDAKKAPQGAGRLVSRQVMTAIGLRFPQVYGYESYLLHKAQQLGFGLACCPQIRFTLLNPLGEEAWHPTPEDVGSELTGHLFYEWGIGMRTLGYHPVYVLMRLLSDVLTNRAVPKRYAIRMAWDYFRTFWDSRIARDAYFQKPRDKAYIAFIRRTQLIRVGYAMLGLARHMIRLKWL